MTQTNVRVQMQIRRDTAANWNSADPVLLAGEWGFSTDDGKIKIGDGTTEWSFLDYAFVSTKGGNMTDHLTIHNKKELRFSDNTQSTAADHYSAFKAGTQSADLTYTLPTSLPASSGQVLSCTDAGVMSWASDSTTDNTKMPLAGGTFTNDVTFTGASGANAVWDKSDDALEFAANAKATFAGDMSILHDGDHATIDNDDGNLYVKTQGVMGLYVSDSDDAIIMTNGGSTTLAWDGETKLETESTGCKIDGSLEITSNLIMSNSDIIKLGNNQDFQLYHDGDYNYVLSPNAHPLILETDELQLRAVDNDKYLKGTHGGAVEIYWDGSAKLATYSGGVRIGPFLKACAVAHDSHWGENTNSWHQIQTNYTDHVALIVENSADSTPYGILIYFSDNTPDNNTEYFLSAADGTANRCRIYSDGDVWTSDAGTLTSDETLKENITDATSKLEDIKKLKVRNFNWKASFHPEKSKKKQIGFIAQEVEEVFPSLVNEYDISPDTEDKDHTPIMKKSIKAAWNPIIIKAMQELIEKVEVLETEVAALKGA